jgi:hypothetical protein
MYFRFLPETGNLNYPVDPVNPVYNKLPVIKKKQSPFIISLTGNKR